MPVINGQGVNSAITNPAFIDAQVDDFANGKIGFRNTEVSSGAFINNTQALQNNMRLSTGASETATGNTYSSQKRILNGQNHQVALGGLDSAFDETSGHKHTGVAGDAPAIAAASIATVPLKGFVTQGIDITSATGSSSNVSLLLSGKTQSTSPTVTGVVVNAPENKIVIRQGPPSTHTNDPYVDGSGNIVYGRLTFSGGVWTLSYYVDVSGTPTAYSFASASGVRWYYQELFNPMVNPPVYSEFASIPSDNSTASVVDATTSVKGKVLLPTIAPPPVGNTSVVGTPNATAANSDHTHAGVRSVTKQGSSQRLGDVILQEGAGITIDDSIAGTFKLNAIDVGRRVATAALAIGLKAFTIAFTGPMPAGSFGVLAALRNEIDLDPIFQTVLVKNKTSTGFDILLQTELDTANYFLEFIAYVYDTAASAIDPNRRSNSVPVASGVKTQAVTFSTTLGTTNYGVVANLINLTDTDPGFQSVLITLKTATGFTVSWPVTTDSANYLVDYIATPFV